MKWWYVQIGDLSAVVRAPHTTAVLRAVRESYKLDEGFDLSPAFSDGPDVIVEIDESNPKLDTLCIIGTLMSPPSV